MEILLAAAPIIVAVVVGVAVKALIRFAKVREGGATLLAVSRLSEPGPDPSRDSHSAYAGGAR